MNRLLLIAILGLLQGWLAAQPVNPINYPWRTADALVQTGETFTIRYYAEDGETAENAKLQGPYNQVSLTIEDQISGDYVIDEIAGASVNLRIVVSVPEDTPDDLYDLIVTTNQKVDTSRSSVKTFKQQKYPYYFVHCTECSPSRSGVAS